MYKICQVSKKKKKTRFQASCSGGEVMLYCASRRKALNRFNSSPDASKAIVKAQWYTGFPGIIFALDSLSRYTCLFVVDRKIGK